MGEIHKKNLNRKKLESDVNQIYKSTWKKNQNLIFENTLIIMLSNLVPTVQLNILNTNINKDYCITMYNIFLTN